MLIINKRRCVLSDDNFMIADAMLVYYGLDYISETQTVVPKVVISV